MSEVLQNVFKQRAKTVMRCFNRCTLTNKHHSRTHTHGESVSSKIADCAAHIHKLLVKASVRVESHPPTNLLLDLMSVCLNNYTVI